MATYFGTGGGGPSYADIMQQYKGALGQQNAYGQQIGQGYAQQQALVNTYGQAQQQALSRQYDQQLAASQQSMANRGLYNTSIYDTAQRGVNYDRAGSQIQLMDALTQERLGVGQNALNAAQQIGQGYQQILGAQNNFSSGVYGQGQGYANQQYMQQQQINAQQAAQQREIAGQLQIAALHGAGGGGGGGAGGGGYSSGGIGSYTHPYGSTGYYGSNMGGGGGNMYLPPGANYYGIGGNGSGGYGGGGGGDYGGGGGDY